MMIMMMVVVVVVVTESQPQRAVHCTGEKLGTI